MSEMKRIYVLSTTEGCATNLLENAAYRDQYAAGGMEVVNAAEEADLILINTCAYNGLMEDRASSMIQEFRDKYAGKEIKVAGCFPKINPQRAKEVSGDNILKTNARQLDFNGKNRFNKEDFSRLSWKHRLVLKLRPAYFWTERKLGRRFLPLHNIFRTVVVNEEFFLITVSTGCLGKCTFCAIKRAKGSLRSRPLETILSDRDAGLASGMKNYWLLADDVGCWGEDVGRSLPDLLNGIVEGQRDLRIVLNYVDPQFLVKHADRAVEALSNPQFVGVNIPLQSGSARVLDAMARMYGPDEVRVLLRRIKARNPGLAIKTNLIVGFPGESWLDFWKSVRSVFWFDAILAMSFSARPHTPAQKYDQQVSASVKRLRFLLINIAIFVRHASVALGSVLRPGLAH